MKFVSRLSECFENCPNAGEQEKSGTKEEFMAMMRVSSWLWTLSSSLVECWHDGARVVVRTREKHITRGW